MKKSLFFLLLLITFCKPMLAQLVVQLCDQELALSEQRIAGSIAVVKARILEVEVYWNEEHTRCYNHYRLQVLHSIKGKLPSKITLVMEAHAFTVGDTPVGMKPGTELVACLNRIPRDWECGFTPRHAYAPARSTLDVCVE